MSAVDAPPRPAASPDPGSEPEAAPARRSIFRRLGGVLIPLLILAALLAGGLTYLLARSAGYSVTFVFPDATNLNTGGQVEVNGFKVGNVQHLSVNNGQALVKVSISGGSAPLHDGTTASIQYKSLLGERYLEIVPGPKSNQVLPSGAIISNNCPAGTTQSTTSCNDVVPRVELQTILNQLDPKTRSQLADLIPQFQQIFYGQSTQNTQATLQSATPTVQALASVLKALGSDGQTLRQLVTDMSSLSTRLVNQQSSLTTTVNGLDRSMSAVAEETSQLSEGINTLPATLNQANTTLGMVPQTTSAAVPLLNDLRTATNQLPTFSRELEPVLTELQPVSAELVPTLNGLSTLLNHTPALVGTVNGVVPTAQKAVSGLTPALNYLRPYSPELAGVLTNWGNWLASYNEYGHRAPVAPVLGANNFSGPFSLTNFPGLPASLVNSAAGVNVNADRQPGGLPGGQPTTDAAGNPVQ
jgi:phospholipid/cholesterol/gamma-HCH transport system substrate-binding protein